MDIKLLDKARDYRNQLIEQDITHKENIFPGGNTAEILISHSNRVESLVHNIQRRIKHSYNPTELRLAAIFHDIGKSVNVDNHAFYSAGLTEEWLLKHSDLEGDSINRIVSNVRVHSDKDDEVSLDKQILQDADELDEIGTMSIIMHAHKLDRNDSDYFVKLIEVLENRELIFCKDVVSKLRTEVACDMMTGKIEFIESFIEQLKLELYC